MDTINLNKTNLNSTFSGTSISEIESILGKEINNVFTYKNDADRYYCFQPHENLYNFNRKFRPFQMESNVISFDKETMICVVSGRKKYARHFETKKYQFEKIGYKLLTKSRSEGWIFGNPKEIK